jgi:prevent-host-death family protein
VFVSAPDHDPNRKGNVAELKIAAEAARLGIPVLRPMTEHERYDLVFELNGELKRVQCKSAPRKGEVVTVRFVTNRRGPSGFIRTKYTAEEIDAVAAYCPELDECFYIPMEEIDGRSAMYLRLTATRNGQKAALNLAADFRLGAVAQLEVAPAWHAGGRGFESHQLHSSPSDQTVPVNDYRAKCGWYMERAAGGEEFLITKRGKPYARLSPPFEQLIEPPPAPALVLVK